MRAVATVALLGAMLANGLMSGFFYAYWSSVMNAFAVADPAVAINAMQAINANVRNAMFAPAFFGAAPLSLLAALLCWKAGARISAICAGAAALTYAIAAIAVTLAYSVPLNNELALSPATTAAVWRTFSAPWEFWNAVRMVASAVALLLLGGALSCVGNCRAVDMSRRT